MNQDFETVYRILMLIEFFIGLLAGAVFTKWYINSRRSKFLPLVFNHTTKVAEIFNTADGTSCFALKASNKDDVVRQLGNLGFKVNGEWRDNYKHQISSLLIVGSNG